MHKDITCTQCATVTNTLVSLFCTNCNTPLVSFDKLMENRLSVLARSRILISSETRVQETIWKYLNTLPMKDVKDLRFQPDDIFIDKIVSVIDITGGPYFQEEIIVEVLAKTIAITAVVSGIISIALYKLLGGK
jgi:hypothetical protein